MSQYVPSRPPKIPPGEQRRRILRRVLPGLAICVSTTLVASSAVSALGLDNYPDEPTEAEASVAGMALDKKDILALAQSKAGSATNPGPNREAFNGAVGGEEVVDFGAGYQIPLDEFIKFGEAGAVESESTATDGKNGEAITGIVGADGGLSLDGKDSDFGTAQVDLLSIVAASGQSGVTDGLIDQADLSFGLGGAWVEAIDGEFQDPDNVGKYGQYHVGDAKLQLHSPAIDDAGDGVADAAGQMEDEVTDAINDALGLGKSLPGMTVDTTVTTNIEKDVLDAILLEPITTDDGLATIDLGEGSIEVDLARIGGNDDGVIDRPVGINNQDPNTELIDDETYPFIASSIHDVIEKVIEVAVDAAIESLRSANVNVAITAIDGTTAGWDMNLAGKVSNDYCRPAGATGTVTCTTINTVKDSMGTVMGPVEDTLTDPSGLLYKAFTTIKTDMITVPVRKALDPFLELIADNLVSLQINHQETTECTTEDGATKPNGVEVSALSLGVAKGTARMGIGNAGVRIDACDDAAAAPMAIDTSSPAPAGGETTIDSTGWKPDTDVSLQLTDAKGNPVGDPTTVKTDGNGSFPKGSVLPIPGDIGPGDYTIVGTDPDGNTGKGTVTVYAPDLTTASPAYPGDCAAVTSGGWAPDTEVTLQLTDASGKPVGESVKAKADKDGALPSDSCVTVPEGTEPGDFTVIGTDDKGAKVEAPLEVVEAGTPIVSAKSPTPAGTETEVTSRGWAPDTDVTIQLSDAEKKPVGEPTTATTDGDGTVPEGTSIKVPKDAAPGDHTLTATDPDGNTAEATVTVYSPAVKAASPVAPGENTEVSSNGWLPKTPVELQLIDPTGKNAGDPTTVTTDGKGNVPEGTTLTVPKDAKKGEHIVRASDGNGATAEAPVKVTMPSIEASSPVPAGGDATLTSDGWEPNTTVELRLTDADGAEVGEPVSVATDKKGTIPKKTTVTVPADTPAGELKVTGTTPKGATAEDTFEVYAPSVEATSPVPAGGETTVTSGGWIPDSKVSLRLANDSLKPVGKPIKVTVDAEGNVPEGTTLSVPANAPSGELTVVASDKTGAEVRTPIEVTAADAPVVDVTSPAPAGGEITVTTGGWNPGIDLTIQLNDPEGKSLGDQVNATTDETGNVPEGIALPIPKDIAAGELTVVVTDPDGNTAETDIEVYAPSIEATSPAPAGGETTVTSGGWIPDSEVSLRLADGSHNPVGEAITVTADAEGNVPDGTKLPVPSNTPSGELTVIANDTTGAEVHAQIEVTAADGPVVDVTSPIPAPAGGEITVTTGGWNPGVDLSIQLNDPDGKSLGDSVSITTDETGAVPDGISLPIPKDIAAGDYTVTVTDPDGNTAETDIEVYAPVVEISSPVTAGGSITVTGSGWLPTTELSLGLATNDGKAIGEPVKVMTDAKGTVPKDTRLPIATDIEPGDYSFVVTDNKGATVTTPVDVAAGAEECTADPKISIDADAVEAGSAVTVTGSGFTPGSTVEVVLKDSDGKQIGNSVTAAVGDDCGFSFDLTIAGDVSAGDYEVEVTDSDGNSASTDINIEDPANAGGSNGGDLPRTGGEVASLLTAAGLLIAVGAAARYAFKNKTNV